MEILAQIEMHRAVLVRLGITCVYCYYTGVDPHFLSITLDLPGRVNKVIIYDRPLRNFSILSFFALWYVSDSCLDSQPHCFLDNLDQNRSLKGPYFYKLLVLI